MKYRILAIIAILLIILSLPVSALNYEYNLPVSEDFTYVKNGDKLDTVAQKLNMTTDELSSFFNKNALLYLAVSSDAKTQIRLSAFTDNFSSTAIDIATLDQSGLNEFKNAISADSENAFFTQTSDGRKFIAVKNTLQDSGGVYTVTQYITICDSKTFYLSCYNEGTYTSKEVESIFKSFELNSIQTKNNNFDTLIILVFSVAIIFVAVAVIMIISIVKIKKQK